MEGTNMHKQKLFELKKVSQSKLALRSDISRQQLDNILKGKSLPPIATARRIACQACHLTGLEIYEPHDFNPTLNKATKNLCDDVVFTITTLDSRDVEKGTAAELLDRYDSDLELIQAMHECVWDGERRLIHHPDRLIELGE
jgi:transcriptional regulator with XRE-family HTH domain